MMKIEKITCTCCGKEKVVGSYYQSQSYLYKSLQYLPICKDCVKNINEKYKKKYKDDKVVIYNLCRLFDLPFSEGAYNGATQHSEKTGWQLYQSYFKQINSFGETNNYGMDFEDSESFLADNNKQDQKETNDENENLDALLDVEIGLDSQIFWGFGFEMPKDYIFLETEINNWKKTHKCDNQAELTLLKEICIKILEIRNLRESQKSVSKEQKELQDLMKTASVDPAKANSISSGQSVDRFGVWIKDIEQYRPAEWHDKQDKYVDMDGFKPYIKNYITRPIKNFFTGAKDFFIDGEDLSFKD